MINQCKACNGKGTIIDGHKDLEETFDSGESYDIYQGCPGQLKQVGKGKDRHFICTKCDIEDQRRHGMIAGMACSKISSARQVGVVCPDCQGTGRHKIAVDLDSPEKCNLFDTMAYRSPPTPSIRIKKHMSANTAKNGYAL